MQRLVHSVFACLRWDLVDVQGALFARAQGRGLAFGLGALLLFGAPEVARAGDCAVEKERLVLDAFFEDGLRFRGRKGLAEEGLRCIGGEFGHGGCGGGDCGSF